MRRGIEVDIKRLWFISGYVENLNGHCSVYKKKRENTNFQFICRANNKIVYIIEALGKWNYELDMEVENISQYRKIMMDLTNEFSDIISDYDALIVGKIFKYNLYPK
ncbi:MAG: hypothetical protein Q7J54_01670 [Candidatus Woesearchaeota archaeon]|nr:hypothetical protein [Candidatus Woesearchaeota archaeon]